MENEIKTRSIRADNESFEKFKTIAEEFPNQAQALSALIGVYEIEKSKSILIDRQTEIESFSIYTQKINELYNHSLLLNQDAEIRIRSEFERLLESKDKTIEELQNKVKEMDQERKEHEKDKINITNLEKTIISLQDEKLKSDSIIKSLTESNLEYRLQSEEYKSLKSNIEELEKQSNELIKNNEELSSLIKNHEKEMNFITEKANLEKKQAILKTEKDYNEKINTIHNEYQEKIKNLLIPAEQPPQATTKTTPPQTTTKTASRKTATKKEARPNENI